jgi:hypothetical protein
MDASWIFGFEIQIVRTVVGRSQKHSDAVLGFYVQIKYIDFLVLLSASLCLPPKHKKQKRNLADN